MAVDIGTVAASVRDFGDDGLLDVDTLATYSATRSSTATEVRAGVGGRESSREKGRMVSDRVSMPIVSCNILARSPPRIPIVRSPSQCDISNALVLVYPR
jgi:hypothetical protein